MITYAILIRIAKSKADHFGERKPNLLPVVKHNLVTLLSLVIMKNISSLSKTLKSAKILNPIRRKKHQIDRTKTKISKKNLKVMN